MTVNGMAVGLYEHPLTIRTHDIATDTLDLRSLCVEKSLNSLSCLERIADDGLAVIS